MSTYVKLRRVRLSPTAWSPPFALIMLVVAVEILFLLYLRAASQNAVNGDFLSYQWFRDFWTGGGVLERGLSFELMKINVLFVVYMWPMLRAMDRRAETVHRFGLIGAALLLAALQLVLAMSSDLSRPRFTLVPIDF